MKEALISLLTVGAIYTVLSLFLPEREEVKKTVSLVLSVSLVTVLFLPLLSGDLLREVEKAGENILEKEKYEAGDNYFYTTLEEAYLSGVKSDFCQQFSLDTADVTVTGSCPDGITPEKLSVILSGSAVYGDLPAMEAYGRKNYYESFEVILYP